MQRTEIISITEYLNAKYEEDEFVDIVKSHGSNQTIMNSTIKVVSKVIEELKPKNGNSDTEGGRHSTYKSKIRRVLKESR